MFQQEHAIGIPLFQPRGGIIPACILDNDNFGSGVPASAIEIRSIDN
jgi:hypothetical protein